MQESVRIHQCIPQILLCCNRRQKQSVEIVRHQVALIDGAEAKCDLSLCHPRCFFKIQWQCLSLEGLRKCIYIGVVPGAWVYAVTKSICVVCQLFRVDKIRNRWIFLPQYHWAICFMIVDAVQEKDQTGFKVTFIRAKMCRIHCDSKC